MRRRRAGSPIGIGSGVDRGRIVYGHVEVGHDEQVTGPVRGRELVERQRALVRGPRERRRRASATYCRNASPALGCDPSEHVERGHVHVIKPGLPPLPSARRTTAGPARLRWPSATAALRQQLPRGIGAVAVQPDQELLPCKATRSQPGQHLLTGETPTMCLDRPDRRVRPLAHREPVDQLGHCDLAGKLRQRRVRRAEPHPPPRSAVRSPGQRRGPSVARVTLGCVEVTESLLARVPQGNLRVPRAEFGALWAEAERLNREQTGRPDPDWYPAAVAVTCRWLAGAVVEDQAGRRALAPAPVTRRRVRAYEELIEAEYLAAEWLDVRRPDLGKHRPGWCEGIRATLRWAWRHDGPRPLTAAPKHAAPLIDHVRSSS